jgi:hypothetical protein
MTAAASWFRRGHAGGSFLTLVAHKVILPGIADLNTLKAVSRVAS